MKLRIPIILVLSLLSALASIAQTDNTLYVRNFKGNDVGSKVTKAMAVCNPSTVIPCILVIDPSLAAFAPGTMPILCAQCSVIDYRNGAPGGQAPAAAGPPTDAITSQTAVSALQMPTSGWTAYHAHGDSITAGTGATSCTSGGDCYVRGIAAKTGTDSTLTNYGVGGRGACDVNNEVFNDENPGAAPTILQTLMAFANDTGYGGAASAYPSGAFRYESVARQCYRAMLAWMATQSTLKYTGSSFGSLPTNWTADTTFTAVTGIKTTTAGAAAVFPYTTTAFGQNLFVFYRIIDGNGGVFSISDSGGNPPGVGSVYNNFTSPNVDTVNHFSSSAVGVIILPANGTITSYGMQTQPRGIGSFNLTVTALSATGAGNVVSILGIALSPPARSVSNPSVWVGAPNIVNNDAGEPYSNNYYKAALDDIGTLENMGLNVYPVRTRNYYFGTNAEVSAVYLGVHPNGSSPTGCITGSNCINGHAELAKAFLAPPSLVPAAPAMAGPAVISNPLRSLGYSNLVVALPYQTSDNDTLVIVNAGTGTASAGNVYLPPIGNVAIGQNYQFVNYSNTTPFKLFASPSNVTAPLAEIEPGQTIDVEVQFSYAWAVKWIYPSDSPYPPAFVAGAAAGALATAACYTTDGGRCTASGGVILLHTGASGVATGIAATVTNPEGLFARRCLVQDEFLGSAVFSSDVISKTQNNVVADVAPVISTNYFLQYSCSVPQ